MNNEKKTTLVCYCSPDGKHAPDPRSGVQTLDDFVVEYECVYCQWYGSIKLNPSEINWD